MLSAIRLSFQFAFILTILAALNSQCDANDTNVETGSQVQIQLVSGEEVCGVLHKQSSDTIWVQCEGEITTIQRPVAKSCIILIVVQQPVKQEFVSIEKLLRKHGVATVAELVKALLF